MSRHDDLDGLSYSGSPGQAMAERAARIKAAPDDILIVPTESGVLYLHPTSVLRWYTKKPMFRKAGPPRLQQLWRDRDSNNPHWRDVPTATGEAQKP